MSAGDWVGRGRSWGLLTRSYGAETGPSDHLAARDTSASRRAGELGSRPHETHEPADELLVAIGGVALGVGEDHAPGVLSQAKDRPGGQLDVDEAGQPV